MKKSAAKTTVAKTPAPAPKAVPVAKSEPKIAPKKVEAVAVAKKPITDKKKATAKPSTPAAKIAPAPKPQTKLAAVTTTIVAAVDVGFGNNLAIRGSGPGLNWDSGVAMECSADDRWVITLPESSQPIVCKFLINDTVWCLGVDYTVLPGSSVVLSPTF